MYYLVDFPTRITEDCPSWVAPYDNIVSVFLLWSPELHEQKTYLRAIAKSVVAAAKHPTNPRSYETMYHIFHVGCSMSSYPNQQRLE